MGHNFEVAGSQYYVSSQPYSSDVELRDARNLRDDPTISSEFSSAWKPILKVVEDVEYKQDTMVYDEPKIITLDDIRQRSTSKNMFRIVNALIKVN